MRSNSAAFILVSLAALALFANAEGSLAANQFELTTTTGQKYKACKIIRAEPDGLVIMHSSGIKKIPFSILPDPLRQQHEVILPWFIKPEIAARYWPTSIQNVLTAIAPEIASAKARLNEVLTANAREISSAKTGVKEAISDHSSELSNAQYQYEKAARELELAHEKAGEQAFPEISAAKQAAREALVKNEREARETLRQAENSAEAALTAAEEALKKTEAATSESERLAREGLSNAGRKTYERLLQFKMQEEAAFNNQRATIAAQKAQALEKYNQEQEDKFRQIRATQEADARRAREAQLERFKFKGPDDFQ